LNINGLFANRALNKIIESYRAWIDTNGRIFRTENQPFCYPCRRNASPDANSG
ncbi:MAG: hypothetical protein H7Y38_11360, partial [Armatimonadetes bacterium]|nr:hypothetical protein [Armatimonadota bacterium]